MRKCLGGWYRTGGKITQPTIAFSNNVWRKKGFCASTKPPCVQPWASETVHTRPRVRAGLPTPLHMWDLPDNLGRGLPWERSLLQYGHGMWKIYLFYTRLSRELVISLETPQLPNQQCERSPSPHSEACSALLPLLTGDRTEGPSTVGPGTWVAFCGWQRSLWKAM